MTSILYEVFPVTLLSTQATLIRLHQEEKFPPWIIQNLPHINPKDIVVRHIVTYFGDAIDIRQAIVHSTSWRYEHDRDQLLLTYLAVLPQGCWVDQWIASKRISVEPIETAETRYGYHLFPPEQIERHYVLAHALDHLASLSTYDIAIQAVLEPEWREFLWRRSPKPAGCIQGYSLSSTRYTTRH